MIRVNNSTDLKLLLNSKIEETVTSDMKTKNIAHAVNNSEEARNL